MSNANENTFKLEIDDALNKTGIDRYELIGGAIDFIGGIRRNTVLIQCKNKASIAKYNRLSTIGVIIAPSKNNFTFEAKKEAKASGHNIILTDKFNVGPDVEFTLIQDLELGNSQNELLQQVFQLNKSTSASAQRNKSARQNESELAQQNDLAQVKKKRELKEQKILASLAQEERTLCDKMTKEQKSTLLGLLEKKREEGRATRTRERCRLLQRHNIFTIGFLLKLNFTGFFPK
ncbi:22364_t:CDS:2 [Entrophospora sp. SA101]|nr:22364_t:CDS:2 [Entrophospora sp. SA101]